ncbi:MAG: hypothetical protein ACTTKH_00280 [Treponema sp.]
MKLNQRWNFLFIFLLVIFSNTCKNNVGLGGHIDITPPTCQLTFPSESLPIIRNSFTLKGVATDDNVVDKVKIVVKSADRAWEGALELPCSVEKSGEAWQWSVVVNKPNSDGSFPLKDGKYNITILAYDKDGKEGTTSSVLIVDNTPPVLFLQRPSSFATSNKDSDVSDNYGADLTIKGTAADDSGLSNLEFFAYGNNKWEKETIKNISTSINIKVDGFFSSTSTEKGIYRRLYGDDAVQGLKTFPCAIKIFDNAKEYDSPDSKGDKNQGNVSSDYYLYDVLYNIEEQKDVTKQLIFPKYKVQDVYDMLKGTFYLNDKGVVDTEKEEEAKRIIEALKTGKFGDLTKRFKISCPNDLENLLTNENRALMGLLGLNPFKSPTFEVLGFKPCKIDANDTSDNIYNNYTRAKGGTLTIKISPNLDDSPLKDFNEFEFYYCELSAYVQYFKNNGRVLDPNKEYPSGTSFDKESGVQKIVGVAIKKVGSSYMATVPVEGDVDKGDLNVGSSYVILVKGKDKEDNSAVIDTASVQNNSNDVNITYAYGVKIIGSGRPNDVKVTKIATYGDDEHEISERAFVKRTENVIVKFTATSESTPIKVSYKLKFGSDEKANDEKEYSTTTAKDQFVIEQSKFDKGGIYSLYVESVDSLLQKTVKKYSIFCDDAAPVLNIKPVELASSTFPKLEGSLYDAGVGVEITDLKVEYTYNDGAKTSILVEEGQNKEAGEWKLANIATPNEGKYKFYFNVKDKLGNAIEQKEIEFHYDATPPTINITTSFSTWTNERKYRVQGTATDSGIGIKVIKCEVNGAIQVLPGTTNWDGFLELREGENTLQFFAEDEVKNASSKIAHTIKVDTGLPTLTLEKPSNMDVLLANNTPIGEVVVVANDGTSGIKEVRYSDQSGISFNNATLMTESSGKYKANITSMPTSNTVYYFWAMDNAGNISNVLELSAKTDNSPAVISLNQISPKVELSIGGTSKTYTNKIATITGIVTDDRGIESVEIRDENNAQLHGFLKKDWDIQGNKKAIFSFSFDTEQYSDNSTLKIKAIAKDIAGNETTSNLFEVNIRQETDLPVVTISSFEKINKASLINSRKLLGDVSDDDGIKSVKIQINNGSFEEVSKQAQGSGFWTWSYTLPSGIEEGVLSLKFKVIDEVGKEFEVGATNASDRVRVKGSDDGDDFKDNDIKFNYDNTQPEISDKGVRFSLEQTFPIPPNTSTKYTELGTLVGTNTVLGNKEKKIISFRILAKDALKLKSATLTIGSVSVSLPQGAIPLSVGKEDLFDVIDFNNVDISGVTEGSLPLKIEILDNSGFTSTWQSTCIVDFTSPVIELTSPTDAAYFGEVSFAGKITDEPARPGNSVSGVNENSITYKIGNTNFIKEHKDGGHLLSSLENTSASWMIKIPNVAEYVKYELDVQKYGAVPPTNGSRFWTIPVQIKATDKAGNEITSSIYNLKFDPNGETPYIDILSPNNGATLGGTVVLSGTARVANPTSGKTVDKVELQLSESNSFGSSWVVKGKDYGQGVEILSSTNILYWSCSFTVADLLTSGNSKKIYFRLRGKSGATVGDWTTPREFTISTDVAQFYNVKLRKTTDATGSGDDYVPNAKWISGNDYVIEGSVTHGNGIAEKEVKTGLVASGIQALDQTNSEHWFQPITGGFKFTIPIKTSDYTSKYGYIEFDIKATDGRTVEPKTVSKKILLKYDNSNPSCAIGSPIVVDNTNFNNGRFTASQELLISSKASYRVLIDGKVYKIMTIAGGADKGKELELENASGLSGAFDYSIVQQPNIIEGADFQIEGVAEDSGSGVRKVSIKLQVGSETEEVVIDASNSLDYNKFNKRRGNIVSYKDALNTTRVSNGKGTITTVVLDEAGNSVTQVVQDVLVKNSPIKIKNIVFATDLSGNNTYDGDEEYNCLVQNPKVALENGWDFNENKDFRGVIDVSSVFTYKNKTKSSLKVVCIGGYKNITASLYRVKDADLAGFATKKVDEFDLDAPIKTVTNSHSDSERTLELDLDNLLSSNDDGKGKFILKVTDQSLDNLWFAGMKIATKVEIGDNIIPKGAIFPFFYNSDKQKLKGEREEKLSSVVYENREAKGHIEIGSFDVSGKTSVSGKVILRGFCYDNIKIKKITLTLPKDTKSGTYPHFVRNSGSRDVSSTYSSSGWTETDGLKIVTSKFTNTGHYVEWNYVWNTEDTLCAKDATIKLKVEDYSSKVNETTGANPTIKQGSRVASDDRSIQFASGDVANKYDVVALTDKDEKVYFVSVSSAKGNEASWTHVDVPSEINHYALYNSQVNMPTFKVDIVPYIAKVTTSLSSYSATPSVYDRTALGHYPCRSDEVITVEGFNLTDARFYIGNTKISDSTSLNLNTATSGLLEARMEYKSGGEDIKIPSLNNTDDDNRPYNRCSNEINNDLLTNNVFIDVWGFKIGARPTDGFISYPVLKISPKDGKVGLAFANGVARFNMAGTSKNNSAWKSSRQFDGNWAQYVFTDFVFDDLDYGYGMATGVDMNKGQGVASYSKFVARKAGDINDYNNYGKNGSTQREGWGIRIENIGTKNSPYTADPDRIQSPSITTVTEASNKTWVYLAYYDAINKHIRYRYGSVYSKYTGEPVYEGQLIDLEGYGVMQEPPESSYSILAGPGNQSSTGADKAGKYVSIGAIKDGVAANKDVVVALWYNFKTRSLMYAYTTDPRKDNVSWNGVKELDAGGEYVKCAIDGDKGIHVVYYSKGDLKYAYLSSYDGTDWKIVTVDSYSLTGTNVSIDLAKDPQTRKWVPYIGYYMAGNANARLAYLVGGIDSTIPDGAGTNEKYTGKWEVSIVPTQKAIRDYRISVGVHKEFTGANKGVLKPIPTQNESVQPEQQSGESLVGGNGTSNPILGYAIEEGGAFELAQKK